MLTMHEVRRKGAGSRPAGQIRVWKKSQLDTRQAIKSAVSAVQAASGASGEGETQAALADALRRAEKAEQAVAELESDIVGYQSDVKKLQDKIESMDISYKEVQRRLSTAYEKLRAASLENAQWEHREAELQGRLDEAIAELNERPIVRRKVDFEEVNKLKQTISHLELQIELTNLRWEVEAERRVNEALKSVALRK